MCASSVLASGARWAKPYTRTDGLPMVLIAELHQDNGIMKTAAPV
jgi:hypothetical protein